MVFKNKGWAALQIVLAVLLAGLVLVGCGGGGSDNRNCDYPPLNYAGKVMNESNWTGRDLLGASFRGTQLQGAIFRYASLAQGDLTEANLRDAKCDFVNLRQVKAQKVDLFSAGLFGADLREADFVKPT